MSTPTKFSLGKVPRTRTGLIPTSYTQAAEKMSTPSHYQELPTKPKPEKYRYRGDYINERNKQLLHKRRLAEKQRLLSLNSNETDSLLVSPRSRSISTSSTVSSNDLLSSDQEKEMKWDSYCQHISCHRLSNDELLAKSENKKHFVSFLRTQAKKRSEKSPKKDKEPEPAVVQKKKKKPPVPRLSTLARTGGKENTNNQTTPSRTATKVSSKESDNKKTTSTTTTKLRYLDFITEKRTGDESPSSPKESVFVSEAINSEKCNVDNDDDSKFRTQIERIVERAAQMVLKDNTQTTPTSLDESTATDTNDSINNSPSINENKKQPNEAIADTDESSCQLQSQKQRLELLEQQVRSMSSSTTDSLVFSSSTIDQDMKKRYSSGQRDESVSCTSSVTTEVLPRSHVQPMNASLVWQQCFGSNSSSFTGSSYLTELDSSSTLLDSRATESKQYTQTSESQEDIDDHSSCIRSMNETVTEVEPRLLSVQPSIPLERIQPSLETCPEETTALPHINPSAEPTREWEDPEPLPRGYEIERQDDCGRDSFDIDIDDIMPRSAVNKGRSETLVDDLFSLL